jgi:GcrA cell cycle regulator
MAAELGGGVTRNAIIGKMHRLGLSGRTYSGPYSRKTPEEIEATKRAKMARRNERRRSHPGSFVMVKRVNLEALRCIEVEPQHKSLLELDPNGCRYPYGDGPFTFCNHPQLEGDSYCGPHLALSRRRPGS